MRHSWIDRLVYLTALALLVPLIVHMTEIVCRLMTDNQ
jgi:hypothetical protein